MSALAEQRCFHHHDREAVALCPSCRNFYCRECVTEHQGRMFCATCLEGAAADEGPRRKRLNLLRPVAALLGFLLLWVCFLALGQSLLELPDAFHEGTYWSDDASTDSEP